MPRIDMGEFNEFALKWSDKKVTEDSLRINRRKRNIRADLSVFKFVDADTEQHVIFVPALDISGYGSTLDQAQEMAKFSIGDLFQYLINLSPHDLQIEMANRGWKRDAFRNKEFSKTFVDVKGELVGFNVVDDKVERLSLVV